MRSGIEMETEVIQGITAEWCDFAVLHWCSTRTRNPQISAVGNEELKSKNYYTNARKGYRTSLRVWIMGSVLFSLISETRSQYCVRPRWFLWESPSSAVTWNCHAIPANRTKTQPERGKPSWPAAQWKQIQSLKTELECQNVQRLIWN